MSSESFADTTTITNEVVKKKRGRKKKSKHGNSKDYDGETFIYKRYDKDGNFQKHGISNDPNKRYSDVELDGGFLDVYDSGTRKDMLTKERNLVETNPGPLNNESWAGSNLGG